MINYLMFNKKRIIMKIISNLCNSEYNNRFNDYVFFQVNITVDKTFY